MTNLGDLSYMEKPGFDSVRACRYWHMGECEAFPCAPRNSKTEVWYNFQKVT